MTENFVVASPPPALRELETVLSQAKDRLADGLRWTRAEVFQKIGTHLFNLRMPPPTTSFRDFETHVLAALTEIAGLIEEARSLATDYERSVAVAEREQARARARYAQTDPLNDAIANEQARVAYLKAKMEGEVFTEALRIVQQEIEQSERALAVVKDGLKPAISRYVTAKQAAIIKEAEETIEAAHGKLRHAESLQAAARRLPAELAERYGIEQ